MRVRPIWGQRKVKWRETPPVAGNPGAEGMAMDVATRRLIFALLVLLFLVGCWVLVIGHQFDLGPLNLANSETYDSVLLGAYLTAGASVVVVLLAVVSAWLKI